MEFLHTYGLFFLKGLGTTLLLAVLALFIGFFLALMLALGLMSKKSLLRLPSQGFVYFIRGTPLLVQIFLIYYGAGQFSFLKSTILWKALKEPFFCAVTALSMSTGAYASVLFKEAILSIPKGEVAACKALGFSNWQMGRFILLPRAFRLVLPMYVNEIIIIIKSTSLASTITLFDLMAATRQVIAITYATKEALLVAGLIYLMFNFLVLAFGKWLERRWQLS